MQRWLSSLTVVMVALALLAGGTPLASAASSASKLVVVNNFSLDGVDVSVLDAGSGQATAVAHIDGQFADFWNGCGAVDAAAQQFFTSLTSYGPGRAYGGVLAEVSLATGAVQLTTPPNVYWSLAVSQNGTAASQLYGIYEDPNIEYTSFLCAIDRQTGAPAAAVYPFGTGLKPVGNSAFLDDAAGIYYALLSDARGGLHLQGIEVASGLLLVDQPYDLFTASWFYQAAPAADARVWTLLVDLTAGSYQVVTLNTTTWNATVAFGGAAPPMPIASLVNDGVLAFDAAAQQLYYLRYDASTSPMLFHLVTQRASDGAILADVPLTKANLPFSMTLWAA